MANMEEPHVQTVHVPLPVTWAPARKKQLTSKSGQEPGQWLWKLRYSWVYSCWQPDPSPKARARRNLSSRTLS